VISITISKKNQKGIALIQVLLISAVLTVLALYLTTTVQSQIQIAQWSDDKSIALVALHSAEAEILYTLLVNSRVNSENTTNRNNNQIVNRWNFFAKKFLVNPIVEVRMQDQSALIHAHFPDQTVLKALITYLGNSAKEADTIYDNLLDWQDLDNIPRTNGYESLKYPLEIRNGAAPDIHDFSFVKNITPKLHRSLLENTTLYSKGFFNPMNATKVLLSAITNNEISNQIIELRETKQLTSTSFSQLTGIIESDKVILYPSNILSIELKGNVGESVVRKKIIIELNPYANKYQSPVNILFNHG